MSIKSSKWTEQANFNLAILNTQITIERRCFGQVHFIDLTTIIVYSEHLKMYLYFRIFLIYLYNYIYKTAFAKVHSFFLSHCILDHISVQIES